MSDAFAVRVERDVLRVHGRDAISYLQGQVSQDIAALPVGDSAWSFVLQPQGKVDAWFRVTRTGDDAVVLDVDGGWGETLAQRLLRFKLRVAFDIDVLDWRCVAVRGATPSAADGGAELAVAVDWPGPAGVDLFGPVVRVPVGISERGREAYDAWRIGAGVPAMGAELTEKTIPAESGIVDRSVSFTKGCYTGQELVARVDSRGNNTPRRLRAVHLADAGAVTGDEVVVAGAVVGTLTSVAGTSALAYVRREVEPPADALVRGPTGHPTSASIDALP